MLHVLGDTTLTFLPEIKINSDRDPKKEYINLNEIFFKRKSLKSIMDGFKLSLPLQVLFGFNGATEALPILAYTAIINDRAQIPLNMLSAYGAISFLPWSFKPIYAFLASAASRNPQQNLHRHRLISYLLLGCGIFIGMSSFIPEGGVIICFVVGFIRAVLSAFPEFLLDLTLLDEARVASFLCKISIDNNGKNNLYASTKCKKDITTF